MKNKFLMFLTLPLMFGLLTGCNSKKPSTDPDKPGEGDDPILPVPPVDESVATIKINIPEEVTNYTCSLDINSTLHEDDKGSFTFETKEYYFIKRVRQNGVVDVHRDKDNKFKFNFTLLAGENVFDVTTYYQENKFNSNGLLEDKDNIADNHGTLTDDVDDRPKPGGIPAKPMPHYENEGKIYFIDHSWWNNGAASTNIICYDYRRKPVNTINTELGDLMSHGGYDPVGKENVWKWNIDLDSTAYVQFVRTGGYGTTDWNARTELLSVADYPNIDCFKLTADELYFRDDFTGVFKAYAKVDSLKFSEYEPAKPADYGTYTVYCKLSKSWQDQVLANNLDVNIHVWGLAGDLKGWPGSKMEKDGDLYKFTIDTVKYQNIIFLLTKDGGQHNGMQTSDCKLPFNEFGKDASIVGEIQAGGGKPSVKWSAYSA